MSEYCIRKGLQEIDNDEYFEALKSLAAKKINSFTTGDYWILRKKTFTFLASKGFEFELINDVLKEVLPNNS